MNKPLDLRIDGTAGWMLGGIALATTAIIARKPIALAVNNPNQTRLLVASLPTQPWLFGAAKGAMIDAKTAQRELFGPTDRIDDSVDAFRHAYGAGLLHLKATREHGMSPEAATNLVRRVGNAHERDGKDNPSHLSPLMDQWNNDAGIAMALARPEPTYASAQAALRLEALAAMDGGRLVRVGGAGHFGSPAFDTHALIPTVAPPRRS